MATAAVPRSISGVVISSGKMMKTVKVRVAGQKWNKHIRKHFSSPHNILVHDPNSSLQTGDIISVVPNYRVSKQVHHVVTSILAPFGAPISARPAVFTEDQRLAIRDKEREAKLERRYWRDKLDGKGREKDRELSRKKHARGQREEELSRIAGRRVRELEEWAEEDRGDMGAEKGNEKGRQVPDIGPLVVQTLRRQRRNRVEFLLGLRRLPHLATNTTNNPDTEELHRLIKTEFSCVRSLGETQSKLEESRDKPDDKRSHVENLARRLLDWKRDAGREYDWLHELIAPVQDERLYKEFVAVFRAPEKIENAPDVVAISPLQHRDDKVPEGNLGTAMGLGGEEMAQGGLQQLSGL